MSGESIRAAAVSVSTCIITIKISCDLIISIILLKPLSLAPTQYCNIYFIVKHKTYLAVVNLVLVGIVRLVSAEFSASINNTSDIITSIALQGGHVWPTAC